MTRDQIIELIRTQYDPEPKDWPRHRGWDDGAGEIADAILAAATSEWQKRPVAFRVPRIVDDALSATEFQLFSDEGEARAEAEAKGCDYQGLYARA